MIHSAFCEMLFMKDIPDCLSLEETDMLPL